MGTDKIGVEEGIELPTDFAAHVAAVSGLDEPPATLEDWWTSLLAQFSEHEQTVVFAEGNARVGLEELYSEDPTRHEVHVNDRVRYAYCVLDALAAAVMESEDTVTVRSIDPVTETPVTITISDDAVAVSPEGALVCYGSRADPAAVEAAGSVAAWVSQDDHAAVESAVCRYTNAFESGATYEQWAAETESVTAAFPPAKVVRLIQKLTH